MAYKKTDKLIKYNNDYNKANYDRINLMVAKGKKEVIQAAAQAQGVSVNTFINSLIDKELERLEAAGVISIFSREDTNSY